MTEITRKLQAEMDYLDKQCDLYYSGDSEISDAEFDKRKDTVVEELIKIDNGHRFLFKVGTGVPDKTPWKKVKHDFPLGSQAKIKSLDELVKWHKVEFGEKLIVQEKLDGISISLVYKNGKLVDAITRGDGFQGELVTRNIKRIPNVPQTIKFLDPLYIRGEVLLPKDTFKKYNLPYKNARNGCSGIVKNYDNAHASLLKVLVYTVQNSQDFSDIKTEIESLEFLEDQGFETVKNYYTSLSNIHDIYNEYANGKRDNLKHDIDGLVIKQNNIDLKNFDFSLQDWRRPKNQVGLKFKSFGTTSKIVDIEESLKGSIICPVAIIEPVNICGVTITRASLANWKLAKERSMGIGAIVEIVRSNDVIPLVTHVIEKGKDIQIPTECPVCKGNVKFDTNLAGEELTSLICTNPDCKAKLNKSIVKWLDKHKVLNIGDSIIDTLIDNKFVDSLYSFLLLPYNQELLDSLKGFNKFGTRKINIITSGIESTYKSDIVKFFAGLNFKNLGSRRIEELLKYSKSQTFDEFIDFMYSDKVFLVDGFGSEIIQSFRNDYDIRKNSIKRLLEIVKIDKKDIVCGGVLEGLSICITGTTHSATRNQLFDRIKTLGGKPATSVSRKTNFLVTNETTRTSKRKKAEELNLPIITEKELLDMMGIEINDNIDLPDVPIDTNRSKKKVVSLKSIPKPDEEFDIDDL